MSYIEQSLTSGEKVVHIGRFHWIYLLSAFFWIAFGIFGCAAIIGGALTMTMHSAVQEAYPSLPPSMFWEGLAAVIDQHGGYVPAIRDLHPLVRIAAFGILLVGFVLFAHMMILRATTEIAVTTSRFVLKEGIIARHVDEMNIDRIESVHVIQSVIGRMLDFGTVLVRGMGIGEIMLPPVAQPLVLRKAIDQAKQMHSKSKGEDI